MCYEKMTLPLIKMRGKEINIHVGNEKARQKRRWDRKPGRQIDSTCLALQMKIYGVIGCESALTSPLSVPTVHIQRPARRGGRAGTPRPNIIAETWDDGSYCTAVSDIGLCVCMRWC